MIQTRFWRVCGAGLLLLPLTACGQGSALQPASGKVYVANQPASGAVVVLHPVAVKPPVDGQVQRPSARVEPDGSFRLGTYRAGDGAPPGEYIVAVAWVADNAAAHRVTGERPTRLAAHYADPRRSPLRVRIEAGTNNLPEIRLAK